MPDARDNPIVASNGHTEAEPSAAERERAALDALDAFLTNPLDRSDATDGAWDAEPDQFYAYLTCEGARLLSLVLATLSARSLSSEASPLSAELGATGNDRGRDAISRLQHSLSLAVEDTRRLNWLQRHDVEVRLPLVYGSRHLFYASVDDSVEGEEGPSDIRAKIDAALSKLTESE